MKHASSLTVVIGLAIASQMSFNLIAADQAPAATPPAAAGTATAKEADLIGHWVLDVAYLEKFFEKELARPDLKSDERTALEFGKPMILSMGKQLVLTVENGQWISTQGGREQAQPYKVQKIEGNLFTVTIGNNPEGQFKLENGRLIPQEKNQRGPQIMIFRKLTDAEWQEWQVKIADAKKAAEERMKAMTPPVKPTPQDQWEVGYTPGEIRLKKACTNEQFAAACKANPGWIKSVAFAFGGNQAIDSLAPLAEIKDLQKLSLWLKNDKEHPLDLAPLAGMASLQELECQGCFTNSNALAGLKKLRKVVFKGFGGSIDAIQFVQTLPDLEELGIGATAKPLEDISPLRGAKKLKNLSLLNFGTLAEAQLAPISELTALETLSVGGKFVSLSFLSGCRNLKTVDLNGGGFDSAFSDISALKGMDQLTKVKLFSPKITDISALAGKANLSDLDITICAVSDLSPLKDCGKLKRLAIIGTKVTDISALANKTELVYFNAQSTAISDFSPLKTCSSLEDLWLSNCKVADVSPLAGCTNLKNLNLYFNPVTDISPLKACKQLKYLTVPKTVPPAQVDELKAALPQLKINLQ